MHFFSVHILWEKGKNQYVSTVLYIIVKLNSSNDRSLVRWLWIDIIKNFIHIEWFNVIVQFM